MFISLDTKLTFRKIQVCIKVYSAVVFQLYTQS